MRPLPAARSGESGVSDAPAPLHPNREFTMFSSNMTVRARLVSAFGALVLLVGVVAAVSLQALAESNDRFVGYVHGINARANMAHTVRTAVDRRAIAVRNLVLVTKPADLDMEKAEVQQ